MEGTVAGFRNAFFKSETNDSFLTLFLFDVVNNRIVEPEPLSKINLMASRSNSRS